MIDDETDKIYCDCCGKEIKKDQKYYEITNEDFRREFEDCINQFCSKDCIINYLEVREYTKEKEFNF